jgi:hypothetical protein
MEISFIITHVVNALNREIFVSFRIMGISKVSQSLRKVDAVFSR